MRNLLLILVLIPAHSISQSLIPNGDFETLISCPTNLSQISCTANWFAPSNGTPDYFHTCSDTAYPGFLFGFQNPHSGNAYAGIYLGAPTINYREYLEIGFLSPLLNGHTYKLSFYASAAHTKYTTDAIQGFFSNSPISGIPSTQVLAFAPQFSNTPGNFLDTLNWTLIQGEYLANGQETHLIIGNFLNSVLCSYNIQITAPILNPRSYAYIDDVTLVDVTFTSVEEHELNFKISPNPVREVLILQSNDFENYTITIMNTLMQEVSKQTFVKNIEIDTSTLKSGTYFYIISNKNYLETKGSFVKD